MARRRGDDMKGNLPEPFSDNLIFWDTEFSSLDPYKGELLSIGMVKMNGEELYLEVEHSGRVSDWVKENVLPQLKGPKISRKAAAKRIREFAGEGMPYLMAYVQSFDALYLYKLFEVDDSKNNKTLPFNWIPIDFSSVLFAYGYDPEEMVTAKREKFCKKLGMKTSKYREHHALDDAKFLRDVYVHLVKSEKNASE